MLILLVLNAALRLALIPWVLSHQGWSLGDTTYFLSAAKSVCAGEWGSDEYRTPLYPWLLCGLSSGGVGAVLFFQNLLVWSVGLLLYLKRDRRAAMLWLWDPILFVYSFLIMSDLIFGVMLLGLGLIMWSWLGEQISGITYRASIFSGVLVGAMLLQRPAAMTLVVFSLVFLGLCAILKRFSWVRLILLMIVASVVLAPRLYWMHQRYNQWTLSTESSHVVQATAGAVVYYEQGLGFYEGEEKWGKEHPGASGSVAIQALLSHFPTFLRMSIRGGLRTLFGHVNIEGYQIVTGAKLEGPGWFKSKDIRDKSSGRIESNLGIGAWVVGIILTAVWAACLHVMAFVTVIRKWSHSKLYFVWILGMFTLAIVTPQLWGDARFRIPVIALEVAVLAIHRIRFVPLNRMLYQ